MWSLRLSGKRLADGATFLCATPLRIFAATKATLATTKARATTQTKGLASHTQQAALDPLVIPPAREVAAAVELRRQKQREEDALNKKKQIAEWDAENIKTVNTALRNLLNNHVTCDWFELVLRGRGSNVKGILRELIDAGYGISNQCDGHSGLEIYTVYIVDTGQKGVTWKKDVTARREAEGAAPK